VPRVLVWDGEGAIGRWRAGRVELTVECQAFRGTLGTRVLVCKPADPEAKGLIERAHDYLERSFLPGRTFTGPDDFNAQLQQWLALANARTRRVLGCAPTDRITADRHAMLPLPPAAEARRTGSEGHLGFVSWALQTWGAPADRQRSRTSRWSWLDHGDGPDGEGRHSAYRRR